MVLSNSTRTNHNCRGDHEPSPSEKPEAIDQCSPMLVDEETSTRKSFRRYTVLDFRNFLHLGSSVGMALSFHRHARGLPRIRMTMGTTRLPAVAHEQRHWISFDILREIGSRAAQCSSGNRCYLDLILDCGRDTGCPPDDCLEAHKRTLHLWSTRHRHQASKASHQCAQNGNEVSQAPSVTTQDGGAIALGSENEFPDAARSRRLSARGSPLDCFPALLERAERCNGQEWSRLGSGGGLRAPSTAHAGLKPSEVKSPR